MAMRKYKDSIELLEMAKKVKSKIEASNTKADLVAVWKEHFMDVGYKGLSRMLTGVSPSNAVKEWIGHLEIEKQNEKETQTLQN